MKNEEHRLQVECVKWFRYAYPTSLIYAIPNGGLRNIKTAAALKAEGVTAGIPDLFVASAKGCFHGCYVEMKNGKRGVVSELQKEKMEQLSAEGYKCYVCRSFEEFTNDINEYMTL